MYIISKLALLLCFQMDLRSPFTCCHGKKPLKAYLKSELIAKGWISCKCGKMTKGFRTAKDIDLDESKDSLACYLLSCCFHILQAPNVLACPNK